MDIMLATMTFAVAAVFAGIMGFAIQRGATCTVVAVEEIIIQRRFRRLAAMIEGSLWVAGGLLVAQALHLLGRMPVGYPLNAWTVVGGALLGLGAHVNRACVFGSIARIGSGEWAYLATPLGFYLGCLSFRQAFFAVKQPQALAAGSPVLQAPVWVAVVFVAFTAWRMARPTLVVRARASAMDMPWHHGLVARVWSPHAATVVIAVAFLVMLLLVGAWSYTDVLTELARGMAQSLPARLLLLLALLGGAVLGGWSSGRLGATSPTVMQGLRCLAGGLMMAWGSLLVPGGNDGLVLLGMPLLWPYAWAAFVTMCVSIGAAHFAQGHFSKPAPSDHAAGGPGKPAPAEALPAPPVPR